ncbi:MAG TPA: MipA/OmpV family protein [Albitalea sp.]|uniref:MipA/OmpV family protein n=1 Tax=Piscinibacter sp. TaxID=1903157 RepID=UPI002ED606BC
MSRRRHHRIAWAVTLLAAPLTTAWCQVGDEPGLPRWEAGLAAGAGRVSDYPGADQSQVRGLVAPVFIYRGPVLRVDQGGIRGRVLASPDWELDLTATGAFNARNNEARRGMPDLDYLFGIGPQLVWKGAGRGVSLHLKARAVMSTDFHRIDERGATFDPELRWRIRLLAGSPTMLTLSLQSTWATRRLHRYFYEVEPADAATERPAYTARAGYLGSELAATVSRRHGRSLSWFASARLMSLHGSANAASPLLRDKVNVGVGAGVVWTPWQSSAREGQ